MEDLIVGDQNDLIDDEYHYEIWLSEKQEYEFELQYSYI
jgi:hypothetical protein